MRHYEIMIILDPNLEERTVQPSLDQFLTVVTGGGGKVDKVDIAWLTRSRRSQRASTRSST
jgi:small subunit ribosomal protein S6